MRKVIVSADNTCDIGKELASRYNVALLNWKIEIDGKVYLDNIDITPDEMYEICRKKGILPHSSGANPDDYKKHWKPLLDEGYEVVHLGLGSGISCAYQNSVTASEEFEGVYTLDSHNLSTGFGHLVIKAAEMAEQGCSGKEIQEAVSAMHSQAHASFLLDTLEFMKASGRCSNFAALSANMLRIKPCIEVDNLDGARMHPGKKYRGHMERCLQDYAQKKLAGRDDLDLSRVFITHSGSPQSDIDAVRKVVEEVADFEEVFVTRANCAISVHCGPRTLGVLYMTK